MHNTTRARAASRRVAASLVAVLVLGACQAGPVPSSPTDQASTGPSATDTATAAIGTTTPDLTTPDASKVPPTASASPTARATVSPTAPPTANPTPRPTPSLTCAAGTLAQLSESERIGQLFSYAIDGTALSSTDIAAIDGYHFGSVWLSNNRTGGVSSVRVLANSIQALAPAATGGVRFFIAADQEGGYVQRLSGPGFAAIPTALVQGTYAPATLQADAGQWGSQLAAAGVNLDFAPVMDVVPPGTDASNAPIGALAREYGHDPATAGVHGTAFLRGIASAGVATTLKHFPGLGRVATNTDYASGVVDTVTTMTDPYLGSFQAGIDAGAPFVMVSLATYTKIDPNHLAAFSPTVITTLLRDRMGFRGVVVSDSLGAAAVSAIDPGTRAVAFVGAGGDLIVINGAGVAETMAAALAARAASDAAFRSQIDAAALHVLEAKAAYGLLACR